MPAEIRQHTFPNGLHVIICPEHHAPVASVQAWVRAGSILETTWLGSGISHLVEHVLFKGTTTRKGARIDHEIQDAGGYVNAYTSFDRTVLWIDVPATGVSVAIDIVCDVLQNATLPDEEIMREMDVIRHEMDMCEDDPGTKSGRRLFETAFTRSHYRFPVIGYKDLFSQLTPEDVRHYYRTRYVPNNTFIVVVGDVDADAVLEQLNNCIGRAQPRPLPSVYLPAEPPQTAERRVVESDSVQLTHLHLAWHVPGVLHPDAPVLEVLAILLGVGRSSRLFSDLRVKKAIVSSVDAWSFNPSDHGLFGISAVMEPEKLDQVIDEILQHIENFKHEPAGKPELEKAIKQCIASQLATRKTAQGRATAIGTGWIIAQDPAYLDQYVERIKRVTPEDLGRVARTYLTAENRTVYALQPRTAGVAPAIRTQKAVSGPVQLVRLANGLRLVIKEDRRLPFVEYVVALGGGVLAETPETNGISQLLSRLLLQGTASRSADQIASEIENVGGHISTFGGHHSLGISASTLNSDLELALEVLADVVLNPALAADALERERQIQLAQLAAKKDDLPHRTIELLRRALFGQTAYGLDPLGTESSLRSITPEAVRNHYTRLFHPANCVIAVFGHVDPKSTIKRLEHLLGAWTAKATHGFSLAEASNRIQAQHNPATRVTETHEKNQAVIAVGMPGTSIHATEKYALELIQEACSDLGSRLFTRIRDRLGLAYYTGAINFVGLVPGYIAFYAGTDPEKLQTVEHELTDEIQKLAETGLDEAELNRARAKLLGQRKLARQDPANLAMAAALDELYGLGYQNQDLEDSRFESVTLDDVRITANKYLRLDRAVTALLRPE